MERISVEGGSFSGVGTSVVLREPRGLLRIDDVTGEFSRLGQKAASRKGIPSRRNSMSKSTEA